MGRFFYVVVASMLSVSLEGLQVNPEESAGSAVLGAADIEGHAQFKSLRTSVGAGECQTRMKTLLSQQGSGTELVMQGCSQCIQPRTDIYATGANFFGKKLGCKYCPSRVDKTTDKVCFSTETSTPHVCIEETWIYETDEDKCLQSARGLSMSAYIDFKARPDDETPEAETFEKIYKVQVKVKKSKLFENLRRSEFVFNYGFFGAGEGMTLTKHMEGAQQKTIWKSVGTEVEIPGTANAVFTDIKLMIFKEIKEGKFQSLPISVVDGPSPTKEKPNYLTWHKTEADSHVLHIEANLWKIEKGDTAAYDLWIAPSCSTQNCHSTRDEIKVTLTPLTPPPKED